MNPTVESSSPVAALDRQSAWSPAQQDEGNTPFAEARFPRIRTRYARSSLPTSGPSADSLARSAKLLALTLAALVALGGCRAHERAGDRAAAIGNWERAAASYRKALERRPNKEHLREKYEEARYQAVHHAVVRAERCLETGDADCALQAARYVSKHDTDRPYVAEILLDAKTLYVNDRARKARRAAEQSDFKNAASALEDLERMRMPPSIEDRRTEARESVGRLAIEAIRTWKDEETSDPIERIELLADLQGLVEWAGTLGVLDDGLKQSIREEHQELLETEGRRLIQEAESFMDAEDFKSAQQPLALARRVGINGRIDALAGYCAAVVEGDKHSEARDFRRATNAYQKAIDSYDGRWDYAARRLEEVRLHPYRLRIETLIVSPVRPNGAPWSGEQGLALTALLRRITNADAGRALSGDGDAGNRAAAARNLADLLSLVPQSNQPTLEVAVNLPGQANFVTDARQGLVVSFSDLPFTMETNRLDERKARFQVFHRETPDAAPLLVGEASVPLTSLMEDSFFSGSDALLALDISAEKRGASR